jgi:hypothetical protein
MLNVLASVAQFERVMLERQREGIASYNVSLLVIGRHVSVYGRGASSRSLTAAPVRDN